MNELNLILPRLAAQVRALPAVLPSVVAGFDGFVDEMITVVGERQSLERFDSVPDIATFGALISAAAGQSSLREIVVTAMHPGGCAVNLGDGLCALDVPVDAFATMGKPVHSAFAEFSRACRSCHSWGDTPGRTLAFEFTDGKLMFSSVRQLADFTADHVADCLRDGAYEKACREARVIAITDWTLYPHMTGVWRMLQEKVFSALNHRPHFFIDLVDPSSRSAEDIRAMLEALPGFNTTGPVTLGLNGNEANILARLLGLDVAGDEDADCLRLAKKLRVKIGLSSVVIHKTAFAVAADSEEASTIQGPYCARPLKSTGAGDRFNAGYCLGLLTGRTLHDCLALGSGSSGFFVRNARSASRAELADFLSAWGAGSL